MCNQTTKADDQGRQAGRAFPVSIAVGRLTGPRLFRWVVGAIALGGLLLSLPAAADPAGSAPPTWEQFRDGLHLDDLAALESSPLGGHGDYPVNYLWMAVAAILVFWMQAGFALVEAGFTRPKNAVNIVMKNVLDLAIGSVAFWAIGFGLMFGVSNGWFGTTEFAPSGQSGDTWQLVFFFFQTMFAATAATIVSGAMAERTRFSAYLVYSLFITAVIYPVFGSWAWGGLRAGRGWLEAPEGGLLHSAQLPGFIDFAGSTVVHSVGGWAALAGAIVLGPRTGRYEAGGSPIQGHSMPLAALGVFILWMGWFGFNAGSTGGVTGSAAQPFSGIGKAFATIAVNTHLSACAGAIGAMLAAWRNTGKPDIGMTLNGALAGLVAITAPCAFVRPGAALAIGVTAGILVVASVGLFERARIDDPVGAISVHGVCGVWGTLAVAIFHANGPSWRQLLTQLIGAASAFWWSFGTAYLLFRLVKGTVGLRVSRAEEVEGLDLIEHGATAYPYQ